MTSLELIVFGDFDVEAFYEDIFPKTSGKSLLLLLLLLEDSLFCAIGSTTV